MAIKTRGKAQQPLTVTRRSVQGSRPSRRFRQQGLIPGVVYGRGMEPISVTVNHRDLLQVLHSKMGEHALVKLRLTDAASWEQPALVHAIQHDPVGGQVVHVDFHTVLLTEKLKVGVPVVLTGEAVGVKQEGGVLEHFLRQVEVECLPTDIPERLEFDVSGMKIGDTLHVRDLAAPPNVTIITAPDGAIASIQVPRKEAEPTPEAAAAAEPEVITERKETAEEAAGEGKKAEPGAGEKKAPEAKKEGKKDASS